MDDGWPYSFFLVCTGSAGDFFVPAGAASVPLSIVYVKHVTVLFIYQAENCVTLREAQNCDAIIVMALG